MGEAAANTPHVLLVSFPTQGHVNPLLRLAKSLAAQGLLVTFSSTIDVGRKMDSPTTPIRIGRGHLRFEFFTDGCDSDHPHGVADGPQKLPDPEALMHRLRTVCRTALADLIRRQAAEGRPVNCVVNNHFVPWVVDVAEELSIPSAVLWIQSCAMFSTSYHYFHSLAEFPSVANPNAVVKVPGLPALEPHEIPTIFLPSDHFNSLLTVILSQLSNIHKATWVFANSFEALEGGAIAALSDRVKLIPVGPLVDDVKSNSIKGDFLKAADCMEWLDSQPPASVVYVSLGSLVIINETEMAEMAYGLLACGQPFMWVVRPECQNLLPEGFTGSVKGKGQLIHWSPQDLVLAHKSLACFVSHCGWNSTLEALAAGVPVIALPQFGDQVTNAKYLVDVCGVGVRLRAPVERAELERCIAEVTKGEKAEETRARAMEWREAAAATMADRGSSEKSIQAFVDELRRRSAAA